MTLAALYATAVGLICVAVRWPDTRLWILVPLLAAVPALIEGGLHAPGAPVRSPRHPAVRRWLDGRFPFEDEDR